MTCSAQPQDWSDYLKLQNYNYGDIHMKKGTNYHYYVEGKNEKSILDTLKMD